MARMPITSSDYTLARDIRELQQNQCVIVATLNYTLARDIRELQLRFPTVQLARHYTLARDVRDMQYIIKDYFLLINYCSLSLYCIMA